MCRELASCTLTLHGSWKPSVFQPQIVSLSVLFVFSPGGNFASDSISNPGQSGSIFLPDGTFKNAAHDDEEIQEVAASLCAASENSVDAAVAGVLSEVFAHFRIMNRKKKKRN